MKNHKTRARADKVEVKKLQRFIARSDKKQQKGKR